MADIGRNERCPCGSGKKYKKCCLGKKTAAFGTFPLPVPEDDVLLSLIDHEAKTVSVVKDKWLSRGVSRDLPGIAETFDAVAGTEFADLDAQFTEVAAILVASQRDGLADDLGRVQWFLLWNAIQTFYAAFDLMRRGFRLQPGMLLRCAVEQLCTCCHLVVHPDQADLLRKGQLSSTKTLAAAKTVIPAFGRLYGQFSEEFSHVGNLHLSLNPIVAYTTEDQGLQMNLALHRTSIFLIYMVAELVFFNHAPRHRCWRQMGADRYSMDIRDEAALWYEKLIPKPNVHPL